jgi:N-acetyltransferase
MITTKVQRTYGSHKRRNTKPLLVPPSSPPSALASSPPPTPPPIRPTKRTISQISSTENSSTLFSPRKRFKSTATTSAPVNPAKPKPKALPSYAKAVVSKGGQQKTLTQLHFNIDQPILRTCSLCSLSYTKGAPDDEALHRLHCTRVRQGMEWGREEEKDKMRGTESIVVDVRTDVKLKGKKQGGRIISFPADIGGKLGAKVCCRNYC